MASKRPNDQIRTSRAAPRSGPRHWWTFRAGFAETIPAGRAALVRAREQSGRLQRAGARRQSRRTRIRRRPRRTHRHSRHRHCRAWRPPPPLTVADARKAAQTDTQGRAPAVRCGRSLSQDPLTGPTESDVGILPPKPRHTTRLMETLRETLRASRKCPRNTERVGHDEWVVPVDS